MVLKRGFPRKNLMERAVFFVENLGKAQIFNKKTARAEKIPRAAEGDAF
ncbi:MAG: hypothetical protein U5L45_13350 [Saprospiraceae bacterium]|nr:hypothetical protein [Saprospiraceae bacterium]